MKNDKLELLKTAFEKWSGEKIASTVRMAESGSKRIYYRFSGSTKTAIGAINNDRAENEAFVAFTTYFGSNNLNVPQIYFSNLENDIYLIQDLGNTTLYDQLCEQRKDGSFPTSLVNTYKAVLKDLPLFQIKYADGLDYQLCYPRAAFDRQSMQWDLSYFKYYFLKLADIPFNEQLLEDDFNTLMDYLLEQDSQYFLYRDFQSRNIMLKEGTPYFIDYQGGRKGALQYDIASLLYDAKADIPQEIRTELLDCYIKEVKKQLPVDEEKFKTSYYAFVLMRIMQAMGAYGFRGFYEKKSHFLQSIPYALNNLEWILNNVQLDIQLPHLTDAYLQLITSPKLKKYQNKKKENSSLTVSICSFSYKRGLPVDESENGGGFMFDCRGNHNPGRYDEYKQLTGKDQAVIDFFAKQHDIHEFIDHVFSLVDASVETYEARKFTNLMVNFGCTGGQHRSVYCAEKLAAHLKHKYSAEVKIWHREQAHLN